MTAQMNIKKLLLLVLSALFLSGFSAFASVNLEIENNGDVVNRWVAHLNTWYPGLNLIPTATSQDTSAVLNDLESLEDALHGDTAVLPGEAKTLACTHPTCGDNSRPGGGGPQ